MYAGTRKYSFLWDYFFISILFVTDMVSLYAMEQPILFLTRIGYLYFLFDRSVSVSSKIMAGLYVFLLVTAQAGFLDRELIVLILLYSIITFIRPFIQMSFWLWIFLTLIIIVGQHAYVEGIAIVHIGLMAWTIRLISATIISSIFCLWLGRKVGGAIA